MGKGLGAGFRGQRSCHALAFPSQPAAKAYFSVCVCVCVLHQRTASIRVWRREEAKRAATGDQPGTQSGTQAGEASGTPSGKQRRATETYAVGRCFVRGILGIRKIVNQSSAKPDSDQDMDRPQRIDLPQVYFDLRPRQEKSGRKRGIRRMPGFHPITLRRVPARSSRPRRRGCRSPPASLL